MYDTHGISSEYDERLCELEDELARPILATAYGGRSWEHFRDQYEESLDDLQERGIILRYYNCPDPGGEYTTYETPSGEMVYDVYVPAAEPAAPIYVGSDIIGEIGEDRTVYCYLGWHRLTYDEDVADSICEAIRLCVTPEHTEQADQRRREVQRNALERYASTVYDQQLVSHRAEINLIEANVRSYSATITEWLRQLREKQKFLDALLIVSENDNTQQIMEDFDRLADHARVQTISFSGDSIRITTTDDLRLHHPESGESRWLGSFAIQINLSTLRMNIRNLNTKRGGRDHPHIEDGDPCFGGHHETFAQLLSRGLIYTLFEMLLQYLESFNPDDSWGRYTSYWFDADDERPLEVEVTA